MSDELRGMSPEMAARFRERAALRAELDAKALAQANRGLPDPLATTLAAPLSNELHSVRKRIAAPAEDLGDRAGRALFESSVRIPDPDMAYRAQPDPNWPATVAVSQWLKSGIKPHLLIRGGVGVGKSVAAAMVVREWTATRRDVKTGADIPGVPVSWLFPDELVSAVFHAYDERSPRLHRHVVIDELGWEKKPDFAEALRHILNLPRMRIVITTNLRSDEMRAKYTDPALISRMNADFFAAPIKGETRRATDGGVF